MGLGFRVYGVSSACSSVRHSTCVGTGAKTGTLPRKKYQREIERPLSIKKHVYFGFHASLGERKQ